MNRFVCFFAVLAGVVLLPAAVSAQASLAGVVKDTSGAVLPGVTVEAASPALIEKTRSVVTDGTGQYKIDNLRPGAYTVTFTLTGFNTFRRDGIELTGAFTATVNADLKVGAVEETITVTGESPIVDIQTTIKQQVLNSEIINALPTGRTFAALGVLVPGIIGNAQGGQDVGGNQGDIMGSLAAHGGRLGDQKIMQNGVSIVDLQTPTGGQSGASPNMGATQEVTLDFAAASAELATGGVRINYIPKDGGNTLRGSFFATGANENMATTNFTQRLKDRGLTLLDSMKKNWDINPGFGGPVKRDKLWFYFTFRSKGAQNYAGGMFYNKNAFNPNIWTYAADTSRPALSLDGVWLDEQIRVTWQALPKHKLTGTWGNNLACNCPRFVSATLAPEAAWDRRFPVQRTLIGEWTSPLTNRLLIEGAGFQKTLRWCDCDLAPAGGFHLSPAHGSLDVSPTDLAAYPLLVGVTEQLGSIPGLQYHGPALSRANAPFTNTWVPNYFYRVAVSYVTGSHTVKVGLNDTFGFMRYSIYGPSLQVPYRYQFSNGVPNQITIFATPFTQKNDQNHDLGLFAQDRWTINRMTLNYALRYDWYQTSYPEQSVGPGPLVPNRNWTFPAEDNVNWKDVTWRSGWAYDLRGDGKTALRVSLNKYLAGISLGGFVDTNPIARLTTMTTRSWNDDGRNGGIAGDFIPQCDLTNPQLNGECGKDLNTAFGTQLSGQIRDADLRTGWGKRSYNWEFSTGVQHEILPRTSVDVGYFRRWYGNFAVTDDLNLSPDNVDAFSITAPVDPLLPNGGGYTITGLYNVKQSFFGTPSNNKVTLSDNYGKQIEHWNGIDVSVQTRLQNGLLLRGGTSTGKTTTDNCEILAKLPEMALTATSTPYCHIETPWLTQAKAVASYTIPRVDVQVAAAFQSSPGNILTSNYLVTSAQAQLTLGRPLAGNAANVTVPLIPGNTVVGALYGERVNQLDLRVGKNFRFGPRRTTISLDVYNATNADTVLNTNTNYTALFRPTSVLQARFFKISGQFDF